MKKPAKKTERAKTATKKPGPEAARVKLAGDWGEAIKKALGKKRPAEGWPEPQKKPKP